MDKGIFYVVRNTRGLFFEEIEAKLRNGLIEMVPRLIHKPKDAKRFSTKRLAEIFVKNAETYGHKELDVVDLATVI